MKKLELTKILFLVLLAGAVSMSSCGKKSTKALGEEIEVPCDEFRSDKAAFRASGNGISQDLRTAEDKALLTARQRLATGINTTLKSVTDRYTNERTFNDASEFEEKFENLTREVTNQELNNVTTICNKKFQKDGKYHSYVAIEVKKDELLQKIEKQITKDQKLQLDYDKMKFEQIFNDEMDKMANEQP